MLLPYFWANKDLYSVLHMINIYLFTVGLCNRRRPPLQHNTFCNSQFAPPDPTPQNRLVASHRAVRTEFNSRLSKENMWTEFRRQRKTSVINLPRQSSSRGERRWRNYARDWQARLGIIRARDNRTAALFNHGQAGTSARLWLEGSMPPCRLRQRKF